MIISLVQRLIQPLLVIQLNNPYKDVIIEGVLCIKQNEHPILIKEKLSVMVPPDVATELESNTD